MRRKRRGQHPTLPRSTPAVLLLSCWAAASALMPFRNYTSALSVNDVLLHKGIIWVASGGGLLQLDRPTLALTAHPAMKQLNDLDFTAVVHDDDGGIWAGTRNGALVKIDSRDRLTLSSDFSSAGWGINDIVSIGNNLIIGSTRGCSFFDPSGRHSTQNTSRIGTFENSNVNCVYLYRDTLFLGCNTGYAKLPLSASDMWRYNLKDPGIWRLVETGFPVNDFHPRGDTLLALSSPSVEHNGLFFTTDSSAVMLDTTVALLFPSRVNCIVPNGDEWYIGTEENYLYVWTPAEVFAAVADGISFKGIDRIFLQPDNRLWILPQVTNPLPWYKRITTFKDDVWKRYDAVSSIGSGLQPYFHAITNDADGNLWVGTWGHGMYHYNAATDVWTPIGQGTYACLSVARDSSGYIWAANDFNGTLGIGSVMCIRNNSRESVDPESREFFDESSPYYIRYGYALNVDRDGDIFFGGLDGKLSVFRHNGNPMSGASAVTPLDVRTDFGVLYDMVSVPDGSTWIGSAAGLFRYDLDSVVFEIAGDLKKSVFCLEAESDSVLWAGTAEGLVKYTVKSWARDNSMNTIDTVLGTAVEYTTYNGLIDDNITDLTLDRATGTLWIATLGGLSRYHIGHSFETVTASTAITAFPNPFSKSMATEIIFKHVMPESRLIIRNANGGLVAHAQPLQAYKTPFEWTFSWQPGPDLAPGTYFYHSPGSRKPGKIIIVP